MIPFQDALGREWQWSRPKLLERRWFLRAGADVLAVLESAPSWGFAMNAETSADRWRLAHRGFLRGGAVVERVVAAGERELRARFESGWFGGGRLGCSGGDLAWKRADFWGRRWEFRTTGGEPVMSFVRVPGFLHTGCRIERSAAADRRADLPELVLLGWFLVLLMQRQALAAS